jgi:serine/threonine-protein kinase
MARKITLVGHVPVLDPPPPEAAALVGSSLGDRYRVLDMIGQGGIGCVFRAEQLRTRKTVALKLLRPHMADVHEIAKRFAREAHVTTRLAHPNIVEVFDFGDLDGRMFLAMELIAGRSLAELLEEGEAPVCMRPRRRRRGERPSGGRLSVARTVAIMSQVLDALEHAHAVGVVHRDLKPENIMLVRRRWPFLRERVKLLDFGIAKLRDSGAQRLTQAGMTLGTPRYMSPEQAKGLEIDARSDIYACGVLLYEMLTGEAPFAADSTPEVLTLHLTRAPRPLRTVAPEAQIPAALEGVVLRALAKSPEARFQSARELRQALERALKAHDRLGEISGLETTAIAVSPPALTRARWLLAGGIVAAGLAGTLALIGAHHPLRPMVISAAAPVAGARPAVAPAPMPVVSALPTAPAVARPDAAIAHAADVSPRHVASGTRTPSKRARRRKR